LIQAHPQSSCSTTTPTAEPLRRQSHHVPGFVLDARSPPASLSPSTPFYQSMPSTKRHWPSPNPLRPRHATPHARGMHASSQLDPIMRQLALSTMVVIPFHSRSWQPPWLEGREFIGFMTKSEAKMCMDSLETETLWFRRYSAQPMTRRDGLRQPCFVACGFFFCYISNAKRKPSGPNHSLPRDLT
jgi:hypothetical protein